MLYYVKDDIRRGSRSGFEQVDTTSFFCAFLVFTMLKLLSVFCTLTCACVFLLRFSDRSGGDLSWVVGDNAVLYSSSSEKTTFLHIV